MKCEPFPLNKVGNYNERDENNTTLPMELDDVKNLIALNNGASVAIAIEQIWKSCGTSPTKS